MYYLGFVIESYYSVMFELVWFVLFFLLGYMVRKYLIDLCCKNEVFGFEKIVDVFDYKILHRRMENN